MWSQMAIKGPSVCLHLVGTIHGTISLLATWQTQEVAGRLFVIFTLNNGRIFHFSRGHKGMHILCCLPALINPVMSQNSTRQFCKYEQVKLSLNKILLQCGKWCGMCPAWAANEIKRTEPVCSNYEGSRGATSSLQISWSSALLWSSTLAN